MRREMREPRNALLGNVGGAVASPLVDDGAQISLLRFGGNRAYQLIREADVELDEIDFLAGQRFNYSRNLIFR